MSEAAQQQEQQQEQPQVERPEYIPEKFWDAEAGQPRLEDVFKSYTSLEQKMSGKKKAPEKYELALDGELADYAKGIDAEDALFKSLQEIAKESDMPQEGFNKLITAILGDELAGMRELETKKAAEMKALGENAKQRIKDMTDWLDANLDEGHAKALKGMMTTAASIEALEKIKEGARPQSLKIDDEFTGGSQEDINRELQKRYMAVDEHGGRLMRNKEYAAKWRADAAKFNYKVPE